MSTLKKVGAIAGIKHVVWIDDLFAKNLDLIVEKIVAKVSAILKVGGKFDHAALAKGTWNAEANATTFAGQVNGIVGTNRDLAVEILDSLAAQQKREDKDMPDEPADLSAAQIALINAAFTNVEMLPFSEWQQKKEAIMQAADDSTLFLVDRDFSNEVAGGQNKGHAIMKELLERPNMRGAFILMSHAFTKAVEITERDGFSKAHNCNAGFAFISKERLTSHAADDVAQNAELASALQDALVRSWCHRTAETASLVVGQAVKDAHRRMLNQTFDDLGGGIFHLSQRDGVPETETMARIFMLAGRIALQDEMLKQSKLHERLDVLRKITKELKYVPPAGELSPTLKEWRKREVWDPADIVNGSFAQPSCGDIYVTKDGDRTFILLGQPCNLAVRNTSERNDNEALLAECRKEGFDHSSSKIEIDGEVWYARFDYVFPINLRVLDAVASSATGAVRLAPKKPLPVGVLLGMAQRLTRMASALTPVVTNKGPMPSKFATFSVSDALDIEVEVDTTAEAYSIPLTRIGRVRSPYSDAVFGALANYHTRMAFDFDFSKIPERKAKAKKDAPVAPAAEQAAHAVPVATAQVVASAAPTTPASPGAPAA